MILGLLIGFLSWPFMEYLLHRFLGHDLSWNTKFKVEHTEHHAKKDYFGPLPLKLLAAVPVMATVFGLTYIVTYFNFAIGYSIGFFISATVYEYYHWAFHTYPPKTKMGALLRKHHFGHHFMNPYTNHGVTTTIFDYIFKTKKHDDIVSVPKAMAMDWLWKDENQSDIKEEFKSDYIIKGSLS